MNGGETGDVSAIRLDAFRIYEMDDEDAALLDDAALDEMRIGFGARIFDELYEDAIFEVTERLGALEISIAEEALDRAARLAAELALTARGAGFAHLAEISDSLARCYDADDIVAARAVGERVLRIGEESLLKAARMSSMGA